MELDDEVMVYLHADEDDRDNINNLIADGHNVLQASCGSFELADYPVAKRLIKEYVRFAWNGASEHFFDHFFKEINGLRWSVMTDQPPDDKGDDHA